MGATGSLLACLLTLSVCLAPVAADSGDAGGIFVPGEELYLIGQGFQFTEGPAADAWGAVYFTDVRASRIYRWIMDEGLCLFRHDTEGANGMYFDADGNLFICQGGAGRIATIDTLGNMGTIADSYGGKRFNRPNDIWVAPTGGIYFTDPMYGRGAIPQGGEHVYCISPDRKEVIRVVEDMVRPNGLIGAPDGRTLYITDHAAGKTYRYSVQADGTLADKALFCEVGADGMTMDARGNVYLCSQGVVVFSPEGKRIADIPVPEQPTNCCFAGPERSILFVTARTTVWGLQMAVSGN